MKTRPAGKFIPKKGGYRGYKAWNPILKNRIINKEPLSVEDLEKLLFRKKRKAKYVDLTLHALMDKPKMIYGDDFMIIPKRKSYIFLTSNKDKAVRLHGKKIIFGNKPTRFSKLMPKLSRKLKLFVFEVPKLYGAFYK